MVQEAMATIGHSEMNMLLNRDAVELFDNQSKGKAFRESVIEKAIPVEYQMDLAERMVEQGLSADKIRDRVVRYSNHELKKLAGRLQNIIVELEELTATDFANLRQLDKMVYNKIVHFLNVDFGLRILTPMVIHWGKEFILQRVTEYIEKIDDDLISEEAKAA